MLPVYLTIATVVFRLIIVWREPRHNGYEIFSNPKVGAVVWGALFAGGISCVLALCLSFLVYSDACGTYRVTETRQIVALADQPSVNGQWGFLGVGYIEGTMVYVYYSYEGEGVYQFRAIDARDGTVHEIPGAPYMNVLDRQFKNRVINHLLWQSVQEDRADFFIPPGTVRQTMNIDMQ